MTAFDRVQTDAYNKGIEAAVKACEKLAEPYKPVLVSQYRMAVKDCITAIGKLKQDVEDNTAHSD